MAYRVSIHQCSINVMCELFKTVPIDIREYNKHCTLPPNLDFLLISMDLDPFPIKCLYHSVPGNVSKSSRVKTEWDSISCLSAYIL